MLIQLHRQRLLLALFHLILLSLYSFTNAALDISDYLLKGDRALTANRLEEALDQYTKGIALLPEQWTTQDDVQDEPTDIPTAKEMEQIMSLHTNYATALSLIEGSSLAVINAYRIACICYRKWKRSTDNPDDEAPKKVAVQSFFFLAMTYQDLASAGGKETQEEYLQQAVKAYAAATKLDPLHWSSYANMGVVLADVGLDAEGNPAASLELFEEGVLSYQKAIELLGGKDKPTDPPENTTDVVSELNYRIGLCLVPFLFNTDGSQEYNDKQCDLPGVAEQRSCFELAAYQFQMALQSGPHEGALNALTLVTADATFGMSTDVTKVKRLFEDYASNFETSLVDDLKYNAFHRMRRLFDKALAKEEAAGHKFELVLDAGCGTGLAGVEFRNMSSTLIGIDISPKIIEQAKQTHPVYDEYRIGDVTEVLKQFPQTVSLLVAADTFIYFNDLTRLFQAMNSALVEGAYAIFSLENVPKDNEKRLLAHKPDWRWQITPSGRIAHRKQYVETVAQVNSFEVVMYENLDGFRREKSVDVPGHFFVLKKVPKSSSNDEL